MDWDVSFILKYFKCRERDKKRDEELVCLIEKVIKSQTELLQYIDKSK